MPHYRTRTTTAAPLPCRIFSAIFLEFPLEIYHLTALHIAFLHSDLGNLRLVILTHLMWFRFPFISFTCFLHAGRISESVDIFDNNTHRVLRIRFNQSLTAFCNPVCLGFLEQRDWSSGSLALTVPHIGLAHCAYTLISNTHAFPSCSVPLDLSATGKTANQLDFSLIAVPLPAVSVRPYGRTSKKPLISPSTNHFTPVKQTCTWLNAVWQLWLGLKPLLRS